MQKSAREGIPRISLWGPPMSVLPTEKAQGQARERLEERALKARPQIAINSTDDKVTKGKKSDLGGIS
jgi:hypothetical protein